MYSDVNGVYIKFETGDRVVGDGHLGQLLPPLWELLTNGLERHERSMLLPDAGGAGPGDEEDAGEVLAVKGQLHTEGFVCRGWGGLGGG